MNRSLKICMIGDFAVGKTALVDRFVHNRFSENYKATLGVQISKYRDEYDLDGQDKCILDLVLWDIEGNLASPALQKTYVTGAAGAVIVGDVSRPGHEDSMLRHGQLFQQHCPGRPTAFAFNKTDLVPKAAAGDAVQQLAADLQGSVAFSSARTGDGVQALFRHLVQNIAKVEKWT